MIPFSCSTMGYASAVLAATLAASACAPAAPSGASPEQPAHVAEHVTESALNTITLTPAAEARLGIEVTPIERRSVVESRTFGGEVIAPASGASAMTRFSATTSMDPASLATAQIKAEGEIVNARVALDLARTRFNRIDRLFKAGAESARAHDDASAELETAQANLNMMQSQRALLGQAIGSTSTPTKVWVRASVYSGDIGKLNGGAPAQIDALGGDAPRVGKPVAAPSTANAQSSSTYLFYEVDNSDLALRVGERVEIAVPTAAIEDALTAPWSAILYDINGGEWVYVRTGDQTYARTRVEVRAVQGDLAALARGPAEGSEVVSVGAPELFGTEFGVAH